MYQINDKEYQSMLTYATVCSGIECMSVACRGLPLKPVFFSEIEPFPCAVLRAHYPDVPNLGDMSKISITNQTEITNGTRTITLERPLDILAGGTPCQDVSVAGKRRGFDPEGRQMRSSLAFDFVRLARELGPRYVLWENVAGSIDSKNGPDFLRFISALGDCGYSLAWRVFDAQYVSCEDIYGPDGRVDVPLSRAVPQRRRRVWVLGVRTVGRPSKDESIALKILFESKGATGDNPPSRRTGESPSYPSEGRNSLHDGLVGEASGIGGFGETGRGYVSELPVAETLRCEGENRLSERSGGDCVAIEGNGQRPSHKGTGYNADGASFTLNHVEQHAVAVQTANTGANGSNVSEDGAAYTIDRAGPQSVAIGIDQQGGKGGANTTEDVSPTVLSDSHGTPHGVAYGLGHGSQGGAADPSEELQPTLVRDDHKGPMPAVVQCFENHAQDSRVQGPIDTAPTQGSSNANSAGISGNNPLVVHNQVPFVKTAHARGKDGLGEKWEECEVAGTRNAIEGADGRNQECIVSMAQNTRDEVRIVGDGKVAGALSAETGTHQQTYVVSTNSNGEHVAATLTSTDLVKRVTGEADRGGGYVITRSLGIGRDVIKCGKAAKFAPDIKDECSPTLRSRDTTNGVCIVNN